MSAGLGLRLWLGLCHHGGAERVYHSWLAGPRSGLGNVSRRPRCGAWAARVKGRGAAMETSPVVSTAPNTAVAQVHWQSLLWKGGGDVTARRGTNFSCGMLKEFKYSHAQVIHNSSHKPYPTSPNLGEKIYRRNLCVFLSVSS